MALSSVLPPPIQQPLDALPPEPRKTSTELLAVQNAVPPLGHRKGWIPRKPEDYGDGGAFPEIHVAQHPLGLGYGGPRRAGTSSNTLAVSLDAEGKIKYDAIARQGHGKDKIVHSKFTDLVPKLIDDNDITLQRPDEEEIEENTDRTRAALEKLVQSKISAAMPVRCADKAAPAQYIRYTPSQQGAAFSSGSKQRIIRMVEQVADPMEPPRFKITKKIPRGPPSPPAPVLHSPNRKVSVKEQQQWKIPPCISNWKNARGYTIPLDKRLAADGRGLQNVHISENFSKLAEALYIADRKAREAVEFRAQVEKKLAAREKEKKEENLRALAQRARDERAGIRHHPPEKAADLDDESGDIRERDQLRRERHKERQRDRNLTRGSRVQKERERDVSEQIALGRPAISNQQNEEAMFDTRLFNQSKGLSGGYHEDDSYNVYDKPWRKDRDIASSIYRPTKTGKDGDIYGDDVDKYIESSKRFVPDREFSGTDRSAGGKRREGGPVQFEKDATADDDPFGLNRFLTEVRGAGGAQKRSDDHHDDDRSSKRKRRDY